MRTETEIDDQIKVMQAKLDEWKKIYNEFLYHKVNPLGNIKMMEATLQMKFFEHSIKTMKWLKGEQVEF
jgi:hypothetical protein